MTLPRPLTAFDDSTNRSTRLARIVRAERHYSVKPESATPVETTSRFRIRRDVSVPSGQLHPLTRPSANSDTVKATDSKSNPLKATLPPTRLR